MIAIIIIFAVLSVNQLIFIPSMNFLKLTFILYISDVGTIFFIFCCDVLDETSCPKMYPLTSFANRSPVRRHFIHFLLPVDHFWPRIINLCINPPPKIFLVSGIQNMWAPGQLCQHYFSSHLLLADQSRWQAGTYVAGWHAGSLAGESSGRLAENQVAWQEEWKILAQTLNVVRDHFPKSSFYLAKPLVEPEKRAYSRTTILRTMTKH